MVRSPSLLLPLYQGTMKRRLSTSKLHFRAQGRALFLMFAIPSSSRSASFPVPSRSPCAESWSNQLSQRQKYVTRAAAIIPTSLCFAAAASTRDLQRKFSSSLAFETFGMSPVALMPGAVKLILHSQCTDVARGQRSPDASGPLRLATLAGSVSGRFVDMVRK